MGKVFKRIGNGLTKTRQFLGKGLVRLLGRYSQAEAELWDELEELLIQADIGVAAAGRVVGELREQTVHHGRVELQFLEKQLAERLLAVLSVKKEDRPGATPWVVLVVGVNGVGKTTTIAKLAWRANQEGKRVLLVAGDTFRAAAIEQLTIWGERVGARVIAHRPGADPSAVAFDAIAAAKGRGIDAVFIDTAGRLHTRSNLMEELKKIKRVIGRGMAGAPHEVLLVLDATTGQNAFSQARLFHEALGVTGIVLTKLDGTAKGGIVIPIVSELSIPIRYVGVGETPEDLLPFDPEAYVNGLFEEKVT
jgi:fused signal recognition particle receptor